MPLGIKKSEADLWPHVVFEKCQICTGANKLIPLYSVFQEDFSYLMGRCPVCSHLQVMQTQAAAEKKREAHDYFQSTDVQDKKEWQSINSSWGDARSRAFRNIFRTLRELGFSRGLLLDVGSAFGHFLNMARSQGYSVSGVEPSPSARRLAYDKFGIDSVSDIKDIKAEKLFDVIVCLETLYYIPDIRQMLREIRDRLSPGGCFVLKMRANRTGLFRFFSLLSHLRGVLMVVDPGTRLYNYSLRAYHLFMTKNIKLLITSAGFEIIKVVNEKQALTSSLTATNIIKRIRIGLTVLVNSLSLGKIKIGTEITIYAKRK